jgi:hypothetical protein
MKKQKSTNELDYRNATGAEGYETVSTGGFPPMWKPERDGTILLIKPVSVHVIPAAKGGGKNKRKESLSFQGTVQQSSDMEAFYIKDKQAQVAYGDLVSVPVSYNLEGEDKLAVFDGKESRLSQLSELLKKHDAAFRIIFGGKIKGGQGMVKLFTIQVPKGLRDKMKNTD